MVVAGESGAVGEKRNRPIVVAEGRDVDARDHAHADVVEHATIRMSVRVIFGRL